MQFTLFVPFVGADPFLPDHTDLVLRHRHPKFSHLFQIWNMLSAHAIYFATRDFAHAHLLAALEGATARKHYDLLAAKNQLR